jgi:hypothetical protein
MVWTISLVWRQFGLAYPDKLPSPKGRHQVAKKESEMRADTFQRLHAYYKPYNAQLRALLRDRFADACVVGFKEDG